MTSEQTTDRAIAKPPYDDMLSLVRVDCPAFKSLKCIYRIGSYDKDSSGWPFLGKTLRAGNEYEGFRSRNS